MILQAEAERRSLSAIVFQVGAGPDFVVNWVVIVVGSYFKQIKLANLTIDEDERNYISQSALNLSYILINILLLYYNLENENSFFRNSIDNSSSPNLIEKQAICKRIS